MDITQSKSSFTSQQMIQTPYFSSQAVSSSVSDHIDTVYRDIPMHSFVFAFYVYQP